MSNGKAMILHLIAELIKKDVVQLLQPLCKNECSGGNIQAKLDLSNYTTKDYLKVATSADTSNLEAKLDLATLKAEVDTIDVGKLKTVQVN